MSALPILPELKAIIDATPIVGTTTYLVTQYGRPFTAPGFGNKMGEWCDHAGLKGLNSHGVRKAASTRAAERGASVHALMAMFGWLDIKQAEIYMRDAERKRLAKENAHLLGTDAARDLSHLGAQVKPGGKENDEKPNKVNDEFSDWCPRRGHHRASKIKGLGRVLRPLWPTQYQGVR